MDMSSQDIQKTATKGFRLNAKQLFLTYPRCLLEKQVVLDALKLKLSSKKIKHIIVARELHEDGTPHLHAYISLEEKTNFKASSCLDIDGYHGNYQSAGSPESVAIYIKKDDDYLEEGETNWQQAQEARRTHSKILYKSLVDNPTDENLALMTRENPLLLKDYTKMKLNLQAFRQDLRSLEEARAPCQGFIPNRWGKLMPVWNPDGQENGQKKRHFWIYSSMADKGKTTFLRSLDMQFPCSWYSTNENFQTIHPKSQFILLDEFAPGNSVTIRQLNQMCDGTYQYPTKGSSAVRLADPIIVICSNMTPERVYCNAALKEQADERKQTLSLINARFNVHCLD